MYEHVRVMDDVAEGNGQTRERVEVLYHFRRW
jgi:hypothetical protein